MDEIVKQAMAKWPNVPHCYGWLALDACGDWRMRDEQAQSRHLPGDRIHSPALVQFINRNYLSDERGCWYFQNGPQRVYVELEATPFIARTDPLHCFMLHTGEKLGVVSAAWITEQGNLILQAPGAVAQVDDRDLLHCLPLLKLDGKPPTEDTFLTYLHAGDESNKLTLHLCGRMLPVKRLHTKDLPAAFSFVKQPSQHASQYAAR
jgi:hypothetical protein